MSELKPNETDVCCECGSTNLDYEELHAEVPDKKGYARLEQEVCYCCDCFAIQSEDTQAAEIERLKAKVAELEERIEELFGSNKSLEAANARMREALETILNADTTQDVYEFKAYASNIAMKCIAIAREALKGEG